MAEPVTLSRDDAWAIVQEHVESAFLRRHMLSVEAAMRHYAGVLGGEVELWGLAGLLHDYDWEIHPTLDAHPAEGVALLRDHGCPQEVVRAILSHNTAGTGVERRDPIDYALLACDEVTGLMIAATLVRPDKDIRELRLKSVKKRWKSRIFAAGVDRDEVEVAVADFSRVCFDGGLELWSHVEAVLAAMQGVAQALELDGVLASQGTDPGAG
jgi:putative nucleotidyltransferase with HDIG domain